MSEFPVFIIIEAMIDEFLKNFPAASFGSAHICLEDYNLADEHIAWARQDIEAHVIARTLHLELTTDEANCLVDHDDDELCATYQFLDTLRKSFSEIDRTSYLDELDGGE